MAPPDTPLGPIEPAIGKAATIPSSAYTDPHLHDLARERVFARSWQFVGDADLVRVPGQVHPFTLLEGCLDEPLLLTRGADDRIRCLSNTCTHRGMLVCEHAGNVASLRCRYHGRRFGLDGRFHSMPEFEGVENFPTAADDLTQVSTEQWGRFVFVSLAPPAPLSEWLAPMVERIGWLPLHELVFDASRSRDYLVRANWALYCDNYLEGFHIPYVHAGLADVLDYGSYRTELFRWSNLQIGLARGGEHAFDLPRSSPDYGQAVAAYYFWVFPNLMFNFYPWGVSVNVVRPLAVDRTRVSFITYVSDASKLDEGAGTGLDRVEREDESIVEAVQRGVRSRYYARGRYSPARERGVHHFHRLLAERLDAPAGGSDSADESLWRAP